MKVIIVSPYYAGVGGLQQYTYNIATGLQRKGCEVTVITCSYRPSEDGPQVYTLPPLTTISNTPFSVCWFQVIKKLIDRLNPDVVNGHLPVPYMADVAARVCGNRPYVLTYHNDAVGIDTVTKLLVGTYYQVLGKGTIRRARHIITTSRHYAERSPYLKGCLNKVSVVPPGVDVAAFNPTRYSGYLRDMHGIEGTIVLFVGQLSKAHRHKGLPLLIQALQSIDDPAMTLVIVGDGNARSDYVTYARQKGVEDRIIFAGLIPQEEMPLYYRGADMTVLPTYTNAEGFGMVLAEANACGRPVIGTKVGGVPSVITDGYNGLLIEPGDLQGLVQAIQALTQNKELAARLGRNGSEKVNKEFTWTKSIARTIDVYDGLI
ncbi:MAG: glycosyltransferase family 4 protein [Halobacteriota archaeon]